MIKRKLYLALLVTASVLFVACSNANSKKTEEQETTSKQEEMSSEEVSSEETTSDESPTDNSTTDQPTLDENAFLDMIQSATISETEGILTLEIEYPTIVGDSDTYKAVNELIEQCARNATDIDYDDDLESVDISCEYEVVYFTDQYISVKFDILFSPMVAAHPTSICYGVTIDIEQAKVLTLADMGLTVEQLKKRAQDGLYKVIYGGLEIASEEEKLKYIGYVLDDTQSNYEGVFYRDADKIYMIVDGIGHGAGDYSILEFAD